MDRPPAQRLEVVFRRGRCSCCWRWARSSRWYCCRLGVVGAILAVPFAAVIKIVLREAGAPRRATMAALRDS
jgi:hypothetical protein